MEKIIERNLLFDFYGDLLTKRQRDIYQDAVYGDLSLSELADDYGISRQGIHDQIKRCDKALEEYESKLHLIARFEKIKKYSNELRKEAEKSEDEELKKSINELLTKINEQL
ncbi:MAG: DNA-binding protein [Lachnospiraceae bacterium]|nr:DNA-binding protein [Lachnospiraceae bacterium]MDY5216181.1 DNA-binding protein [Lachnospiraceae bacterium]